MENSHYAPTILDFAYEIIAIHEENQHLRRELKHYKSMHEMNCKSTKASIKSGEEFMGLMLKAALDPNSVVNKGHEAILKEQISTDQE